MIKPETANYLLPLAGYKARKASQIAAYFAVRSAMPKKGTIEKLKLIKLIYLSEREFIKQHHFPMLYDEFYSLPNGPICSATLSGIDGQIHNEIWNDYIARNGNVVVAIKNFTRDELDYVSNAELKVLKTVWAQFGDMTASQLGNYSHANCPEYTEITNGRIPISYSDVAKAVGIEREEAEMIEGDIGSLRRASNILRK